MTTLIFYEKPGCATNARQKRLLLDAGHEVIARDLLNELWTAQRLRDFFADLPVADWFNRAAPQLKSGEIDPALIDAQAALEMMLSDPLLIRRPLIEADGWHLAGFDATQIELRLGAAAHGEAPPDLENCSRPDTATPCAPPQDSAPSNIERAQVALAYHERTKHRPDHYASGPETLDWTMQPDPFRTFKGSPSIRLPHCASRIALAFEHADKPEAFHPPAVTLYSLGALLELSLGLSAWKEYGPDRWALRCNPSSGNLHPTEGYLVSRALPDLADGVYHYRPDAHLLEQRAAMAAGPPPGAPVALLGLTSIHWREAWKYGERAYRYCQLDVGHALAALSYAAALLGWRLRPLTHWSDAAVAALLGVDRPTHGAETEHPDLLLAVDTGSASDPIEPDAWITRMREAEWRGRPNVLDRRPLYRWPVIEAVSRAAAKPGTSILSPAVHDAPAVRPAAGDERPAMAVIRERRSAQAYDPAGTMPLATLEAMLDRLIPRAGVPPWVALPESGRLHPLLFVHRVDALAPGLYALPRSAAGRALLRGALDARFAWDACPELNLDGATLYRLAGGDMRRTAGLLCCHQAIAAHGAVTFMLLGEWDGALDAEPWRYRWRHWEAGALGQVLYLHAEAAGLRGTGIGCYFDPAVHEVLGLPDRRLQSLYHFTIGRPLLDARIQSLPPYAHLQRD